MAQLRQRWFDKFIHGVMSRPWRVMLAFTAILLASAFVAQRLEFRGSFVELLPEGAQEVKDLNKVSQKAGGDGYLIMVAQGAAPEQLKAFSAEASAALEKLPEVRYVEHHYDVAFFRQHALLLLPAEKLKALRGDIEARVRYEKEIANPLYVDLGSGDAPPTFEQIAKKYSPDVPMKEELGSADGKEAYLMVKPAGTAADLDFTRKFVDRVKEVAAQVAQRHPGVKLDYTGNFQNRLEEDRVMRNDLSNAGTLSALIAVGLILLATRRLSALAVVGLPVFVGVMLTFAFAQVSIGHLNIVTGFLVAILIGLGIEYGIHLAMRYWEERQTLSARDAMAATVKGTFAGALTSALTNAAAFFVLLMAQFHAFKQFGLLAGMGVMLALFAAYAMGPSLLAIAERIRPARKDDAPAAAVHGAAAPSAPAAPEKQYRRMPTALIAGIALSVVAFAGYSVYVAPRLGFETNMRKLKGNPAASSLSDHITKEMGTPLSPAVLLVDDLKQVGIVEDVVAEVQKKNGANSAILRSASLDDVVPKDLEHRQAEIAGIKKVLGALPESVQKDARLADFKQMLDAQPYGPEKVPVEFRRRLEALDGKGLFVLLFPSVDNDDTKNLDLWAAQLDQVVEGAKAKGVNLSVLDSNRIASRILSLVRGDGPFILWSAALVVFLVIWASLRSFKHAMMVAGPLFLGMVCLAGGMYLFDVQLNFINAVVLPNLLSIAVDNSVHLFHRYEEEGPGSLGKVVRHTGLAAVVATISNAAGYGALLIASHQGLRSIGQIAILGVVCTFLGTTVFFPAMLALMERWKYRKTGGVVTGEGAVVTLGVAGAAAVVAAEEPEPEERKSA